MRLFPVCQGSDPCPCGRTAAASSGRQKVAKRLNHAHCCQPFHRGEAAPDAEALMRSRYTAYVLGLEGYLRSTWHPSTCPTDLELDPAQHWLGLAVIAVQTQSPTEATVEFAARYRWAGRGHRLQECSRFVLEQGRWWYVDGDVHP